MEELRECKRVPLDLPDGRYGIGIVRGGVPELKGVFESSRARDEAMKPLSIDSTLAAIGNLGEIAKDWTPEQRRRALQHIREMALEALTT